VVCERESRYTFLFTPVLRLNKLWQSILFAFASRIPEPGPLQLKCMFRFFVAKYGLWVWFRVGLETETASGTRKLLIAAAASRVSHFGQINISCSLVLFA